MRGIPRVREWKVKLYRRGKLVDAVTVHAVNRRFAVWNGTDLLRAKLGWEAVYRAERMTATPLRENAPAKTYARAISGITPELTERLNRALRATWGLDE